MSIVFTVLLYLTAGGAIVVWLAGQSRLPSGIAVRIAAVIFWPAYLPICLSPPPRPHDPALEGLAQQIDRLPIPEARRAEYREASAKLGKAVEKRRAELARLAKTEERLDALRGTLGQEERLVVDRERARVREARVKVERDLARARESVLRLVLRLELIDLEGSRENLDENLAAVEAEIGLLLEARLEAEADSGVLAERASVG